jgi:hypothetical protein
LKENQFSKKEANAAMYDECKQKIDQALGMIINGAENMLYKYLEVQSRFPEFSVRNSILTAIQCPDAKDMRTIEQWGMEGAKIKNDEKPLKLLEVSNYVNENKPDEILATVVQLFDVNQTTLDFTLKNRRVEKLSQMQGGLWKSMPCPVYWQAGLDEPATYDYDKHEVLVRKPTPADTQEHIFEHAVICCAEATYDVQEKELPRDVRIWMSRCVGHLIMNRFRGNVCTKAPTQLLPDMRKKYDTKQIMDVLEKIRRVYWLLVVNIGDSIEEAQRKEPENVREG